MKNALFYSGKNVLVVDDGKVDFKDNHSLFEDEVKLDNEREIASNKLNSKRARKRKVKKNMKIFGAVVALGVACGFTFFKLIGLLNIIQQVGLAGLSLALIGCGLYTVAAFNQERKGLSSEIDYLQDYIEKIDRKKENLKAVKQKVSVDLKPKFVDLSKSIEIQKVSLNRQLELLYLIGAYHHRYQQLARDGEFEEEFQDLYLSEEIEVAKRALNKKSR